MPKSLLFVDDEPKVLQGLQRQLRAMRQQWDMHFMEGGAQALDYMSKAPVDVIVTDMMMPGMDGAQLLNEVSQTYPNTVRLVLSGHADREAILRLVGPAHQYLSKPCNAEELRTAIARALTMRDLLANERLKEVASRIRCLPSLPTLLVELTTEFNRDDPSIDRITEIIGKDLGMTTKILQLVNSAFFGLPKPATNIMDAVVYLGLSTLRGLVLTLRIFSQFDPRLTAQFPIQKVVEHCWATGVLARRIAQAENTDAKVTDQCFLAGLLHDLGYLILAEGLGEQYSDILRKARSTGHAVVEIEQAELGATHAEVGAYLLGLWGLPVPIVEAVALHHRPAAAQTEGFSPLIAVHAANSLVHDIVPNGVDSADVPLDASWLATLGFETSVERWRVLCSEPFSTTA